MDPSGSAFALSLRIIKYISTYTCNTTKKTAAKPPAERSEANKVSIYLYMFSAEGEQLFFTYVNWVEKGVGCLIFLGLKVHFLGGGGINFEFWWGILIFWEGGA